MSSRDRLSISATEGKLPFLEAKYIKKLAFTLSHTNMFTFRKLQNLHKGKLLSRFDTTSQPAPPMGQKSHCSLDLQMPADFATHSPNNR